MSQKLNTQDSYLKKHLPSHIFLAFFPSAPHEDESVYTDSVAQLFSNTSKNRNFINSYVSAVFPKATQMDTLAEDREVIFRISYPRRGGYIDKREFFTSLVSILQGLKAFHPHFTTYDPKQSAVNKARERGDE